MRSLHAAAVVTLVFTSAACGGGAALNEPSAVDLAGASTRAPILELSPESGRVDRVGPDDGALHPDGVKDLAFNAVVEGPIAALFLVSVDEHDAPTGQFQADTLVGQVEGPHELGAKPGSGTSGLGVSEYDRMLNAADGSLPALAPGPHRLTLYVAATATLKPGTRLRLYVLRADRSLLPGPSAIVL